MTPASRRCGLAEPPVDLLLADDPVAAFVDAHARARPVALRTSGTSGVARAVVRSTESWVRSFPQVAALLGMDADSRVWVPGPLGSTMNLFAHVHAAAVGAAVVGSAAEASHAHLTPGALARALDDGVRLEEVHVVVAGDRLPAALAARARAAGARVSHYYGAAELSFVAWGEDEGSLRPFPGVEVETREGELWVRSPYLCQGYDGAPGPLRWSADGFATVGDRGRLVDGRLLVHGRGEAAVTTGGATVHVADVEQVLRPVAGDVVVLGLPHATLGEVVVAVLTGADAFVEARETARRLLSPAQRPRVWYAVPEVPLTPAGKVDRATLRQWCVSGAAGLRRLT